MAWTSVANRLASLPAIIAGPIVRRVDPYSATIWLALTVNDEVRLSIQMVGQSHRSWSATATPQRVGTSSLYLALITVRGSGGAVIFEPDQVYTYEIRIGSRSFAISIGARDERDLNARFGYGGLPPTFVLPSGKEDRLNVAYGSRRKPHGIGEDAFAVLDEIMLSANGNNPTDTRPQALFMTGGQIYADEVCDTLFLMIRDVVDTLHLPDSPDITSERRETWLREAAGIPAPALEFKRLRNHLVTLGEYLAMYLLVWSDSLWPLSSEDLPAQQARPGASDNECAKLAGTTHEDVLRLTQFREGLSSARRVMANVATYMVLDVHDLVYGWYQNRSWATSVLSPDSQGLHHTKNALEAGILCQSLGNDPQLLTRFDPSRPSVETFVDEHLSRALLDDDRKTTGLETAITAGIFQFILADPFLTAVFVDDGPLSIPRPFSRMPPDTEGQPVAKSVACSAFLCAQPPGWNLEHGISPSIIRRMAALAGRQQTHHFFLLGSSVDVQLSHLQIHAPEWVGGADLCAMGLAITASQGPFFRDNTPVKSAESKDYVIRHAATETEYQGLFSELGADTTTQSEVIVQPITVRVGTDEVVTLADKNVFLFPEYEPFDLVVTQTIGTFVADAPAPSASNKARDDQHVAALGPIENGVGFIAANGNREQGPVPRPRFRLEGQGRVQPDRRRGRRISDRGEDEDIWFNPENPQCDNGLNFTREQRDLLIGITRDLTAIVAGWNWEQRRRSGDSSALPYTIVGGGSDELLVASFERKWQEFMGAWSASQTHTVFRPGPSLSDEAKRVIARRLDVGTFAATIHEVASIFDGLVAPHLHTLHEILGFTSVPPIKYFLTVHSGSIGADIEFVGGSEAVLVCTLEFRHPAQYGWKWKFAANTVSVSGGGGVADIPVDINYEVDEFESSPFESYHRLGDLQGSVLSVWSAAGSAQVIPVPVSGTLRFELEGIDLRYRRTLRFYAATEIDDPWMHGGGTDGQGSIGAELGLGQLAPIGLVEVIAPPSSLESHPAPVSGPEWTNMMDRSIHFSTNMSEPVNRLERRDIIGSIFGFCYELMRTIQRDCAALRRMNSMNPGLIYRVMVVGSASGSELARNQNMDLAARRAAYVAREFSRQITQAASELRDSTGDRVPDPGQHIQGPTQSTSLPASGPSDNLARHRCAVIAVLWNPCDGEGRLDSGVVF